MLIRFIRHKHSILFGPFASKEEIKELKMLPQLLDSLKACPHPLKGQRVRYGTRGTNPYMNNDDKKNVIIDKNGQPGTNDIKPFTLKFCCNMISLHEA
jgi:hypothetical protein